MAFKDEYYNKLLGLEHVDDSGLPVTPEEGIIDRYNTNPRYRTDVGSFVSNEPYDPTGPTGVMYRGIDDYVDTKYGSQSNYSRLASSAVRFARLVPQEIMQGFAFTSALAWEATNPFN